MAFGIYKGELNRFGGDASKQRAISFARKNDGEVYWHPDFKVRGASDCYVVVKAGSPPPESDAQKIEFE